MIMVILRLYVFFLKEEFCINIGKYWNLKIKIYKFFFLLNGIL